MYKTVSHKMSINIVSLVSQTLLNYQSFTGVAGTGRFYSETQNVGKHLMIKFILTGTAICTALLASSATASEAEDMAVGIKCLPAKKIVKLVRKFDGMKPEKKDTVRAFPEMQLSASEGGALPERIYFRDGTSEHKFNMDEDGIVTDFARIGTMNKKGELCMQGQQFIGTENGASGINLSMDFDIRFKNTSGEHTMAELIDGTKDGKAHYKKIVPGPMAIMVPKLAHVGVTYSGDAEITLTGITQAEITKPEIYAVKSGSKIDGLLVEKFGDMFVISIENLQDLGADALKIEGGEYTLNPIPSIEKMKKLGFGQSGNKEDAE